MDRDGYKHGFPPRAWGAAKQEAREIMRLRAKRGDPISYSELVAQIRSVAMDAHDPRLAHFLGEISRAEDEKGRGLLTAVVVHKHDGFPGDGFFELAEELGREVDDREAFWIEEIARLKREAPKA
jgi:hypothetical protein